MQAVPHWQWLMLLYFIVVAIPVLLLHNFLKKRLLLHRKPIALLLYFIALPTVAFVMHVLAMWLYYKFLFFY